MPTLEPSEPRHQPTALEKIIALLEPYKPAIYALEKKKAELEKKNFLKPNKIEFNLINNN